MSNLASHKNLKHPTRRTPVALTAGKESPTVSLSPILSGRDLPFTEQELFQLDHFSLLDTHHQLSSIGNLELLRELLELMHDKSLPEDMNALEKAFNLNDWPQIEKIAHKIKSGALYCGTIRLKYASQYMERYHQAGHRSLLNELYEQLILTIRETTGVIEEWLESYRTTDVFKVD